MATTPGSARLLATGVGAEPTNGLVLRAAFYDLIAAMVELEMNVRSTAQAQMWHEHTFRMREQWHRRVRALDLASDCGDVARVILDCEASIAVDAQHAWWLNTRRTPWIERLRGLGLTDVPAIDRLSSFAVSVLEIGISLKHLALKSPAEGGWFMRDFERWKARLELIMQQCQVAYTERTRMTLERAAQAAQQLMERSPVELLPPPRPGSAPPPHDTGMDIEPEADVEELDATLEAAISALTTPAEDDMEEEEDGDEDVVLHRITRVPLHFLRPPTPTPEPREEPLTLCRAREMLEEAERQLSCRICYSARRDTVLLPCLHLAACSTCLSQHENHSAVVGVRPFCPWCRQPIQGKLLCITS